MLGNAATSTGVEPRALRDAIGHFATGVAVVTAGDAQGRPFGSTANAISSVSLEPPLVLACLRRESETLAALQATGRFAINVLSADQQELSDRFAKATDDGSWAGVGHRRPDGVPVLDDALASLECTLHDTGDGGDHVIVVGHVRAVDQAHPQVEPLLFFRGDYGRFGTERPVPRLAPTPLATTEAEAEAAARATPAERPTVLPSRLGPLRMLALSAGDTSAAVLIGDPENSTGATLELHRGCVLGSLACRGRERLHASLRRLRGSAAPAVLVYVREGHGGGECCGAAPRPLSDEAVAAARQAVEELGLQAPRWRGSTADAERLRAAGIELAAPTATAA